MPKLTLTRAPFALLATVGLALALACAGDSSGIGPQGGVVGGRCSKDGDCAERCARGNDFPGGYCTVTCRRDADCPSGTLCIEKNDGICLVPCSGQVSCAGFGPEYRCDNLGRQGMKDVDADVCVGR